LIFCNYPACLKDQSTHLVQVMVMPVELNSYDIFTFKAGLKQKKE